MVKDEPGIVPNGCCCDISVYMPKNKRKGQEMLISLGDTLLLQNGWAYNVSAYNSYTNYLNADNRYGNWSTFVLILL